MGFLGGVFGGSGNQTSNSNSHTTSTTNYPDWFNQATQGVGTNVVDLSNYKTHPYPTFDTSNIFAPFNSTQQQAFNQTGNLQSSYQPFFNAATGVLGQTQPASAGYFSSAGSQPTALMAAVPFTSAAATPWTAPGVSSNYMNPYISGSVDYANQLASQNFTQNVLPQLTNQFVASGGGLGSSQYDKSMDWALKNFNNTIAGNTQNALASGYFNSANLFNQDQSRMAQLAGLTGNQASASQYGLTNLGNAVSGSGVSNAGAFGNLGSGYLSSGLRDTNALLQIGNQQQQQQQNPLTFNYQQALNQFNWPYQATSWSGNTLGGLRVPTTNTSDSYGTQTRSGGSSASPFGSILGGLSGVASLFGTGGIPGMVSTIGGWLGGGGGDQLPGPGTGYTYRRGGYFDIDRASNPTRDDTRRYWPAVDTRRYARGGYYADGGDVLNLYAEALKRGRQHPLDRNPPPMYSWQRPQNWSVDDLSDKVVPIRPIERSIGGYFDIDRASNFSDVDTRLYRRGGHFTPSAGPKYPAYAAGGFAPAVKVARAAARNDAREVAEQAGRGQLAFANGGYFNGGVLPAPHKIKSTVPGYF